jgi:dipeptidase
MCSEDLREFIADNHLDLSLDGVFNARRAFGSHTDSDHVYNTPRAWIIRQYFNPSEGYWGPEDDDIPWCAKPEHKITVEDVKYVLSNHYQGTDFDPYSKHADPQLKGSYRPIGVNRNNFLSLVQIRPYLPEEIRVVEWVAMGSNMFNALVPYYANIETAPEYLANTTAKVTTESFYWANRIIAALADASYKNSKSLVERYQSSVLRKGLEMIVAADKEYLKKKRRVKNVPEYCGEVNEKITAMVREQTDEILAKVLDEATNVMKNSYSRSDY